MMDDFFSSSGMFWLIVALGVLTFSTRIAGHLMLVRFGAIHPRLEAALQAVPAAVISTLVFPAALTRTPLEFLTILLVALLCLRLSAIWVLVLGLGFLVAGRQLLGL